MSVKSLAAISMVQLQFGQMANQSLGCAAPRLRYAHLEVGRQAAHKAGGVLSLDAQCGICKRQRMQRLRKSNSAIKVCKDRLTSCWSLSHDMHTVSGSKQRGAIITNPVDDVIHAAYRISCNAKGKLHARTSRGGKACKTNSPPASSAASTASRSCSVHLAPGDWHAFLPACVQDQVRIKRELSSSGR